MIKFEGISAYIALRSLKCGPVDHDDIGGLTHLHLDKMAAIMQTTYSNAFSWMKNFDFLLKIHWSLFLRVQLTIT